MKIYNPIKMYGSYAGTIVGLIISKLSLKYFWYDFIDLRLKFETGLCSGINSCVKEMMPNVQSLIPLQYIIYALIGFIVGYGINLIWRNRKENVKVGEATA